MKRFHNILYVSHGISDEGEGLKQALSLARNNSAMLRVLVVYPEFPKSHQEYLGVYEDALTQRMQQAIASVQQAIQQPLQSVPVVVKGGRALAALIVQDVQQHGHDLVIKQAEARPDKHGLMAIDMELLRQCPCAVWLSRPIARSRQEMQVAVAIDPQAESPGEQQLALELLRLGRSLADTCNGTLQVISCWDYEFEAFLRGSMWSRVADDELVRIVRDVEARHRADLNALLQASGVGGAVDIVHRRGDPSVLIPQQVQTAQVDVLVMGTLARAGIAGYVIGNTAENVVQAVECSLLTLKPAGFASPVR
jgi:nucleotide-binding universal stress UspA family protein